MTAHRLSAAALTALSFTLLAACGSADPQPKSDEGDPALTGALGDQITADPDLARQNEAAGVAAIPARDGTLPSLDVTPDAIARARTDALALLGGPGKLKKAPQARELAGALPAEAELSAAARAANAPGANGGDCASRVEYTAAWAAKLPQPFPVYPRGAVQEAAGSDAHGCSLRVVNFHTPVPLSEVLDFYYTRAAGAGFSVQHVRQDGDNVMGGVKGKASFTLYARTLKTGATEVDLVTSG